MLTSRFKTAAIVLAASAGLAGCAYGPYGGVSVGAGYGSPYGYGGYGYDPFYYGYGYGNPYYNGYYGWYDGFYYPGSGWYVYDHNHHPHPISDNQKSYWAGQLEKWRQQHGTTAQVRESWSGFSKQSVSGSATAAGTAQADQQSVRQIIEARRAAQVERQRSAGETGSARSDRQESGGFGAMRERIREHRARRAPGG